LLIISSTKSKGIKLIKIKGVIPLTGQALANNNPLINE